MGFTFCRFGLFLGLLSFSNNYVFDNQQGF